MQRALQIHFHGMDSSEALEARIRERVDRARAPLPRAHRLPGHGREGKPQSRQGQSVPDQPAAASAWTGHRGQP